MALTVNVPFEIETTFLETLAVAVLLPVKLPVNQDAACVEIRGFVRCTAFSLCDDLQQQSIPMHIRRIARIISAPPPAMTPMAHSSSSEMPSIVKLQATRGLLMFSMLSIISRNDA